MTGYGYWAYMLKQEKQRKAAESAPANDDVQGMKETFGIFARLKTELERIGKGA